MVNPIKLPQVKVEDSLFSRSFGSSIGKEFNNANDLMNWLIFGEDKHFYSKPSSNETF